MRIADDVVPGLRAHALPLVAGVLLAACAYGPPREAGVPAAPSPQLLSAGDLELPDDCRPEPGVVYRATYTVQPDGHATGIESTPATGCVQDALGRWVSTFRYRPAGAPAPAVLDWMFVTASGDR